MKCLKCQGPYHVAICDSEPTLGGQDQENVASVSTSMYVNPSRGSVLLQIATAEVVRPDNDNHLLKCSWYLTAFIQSPEIVEIWSDYD